MNGRLHLGHGFTITKADFAAGYNRLKGRRVLFPFAFHCTGMPIQAAANKLKREFEEFGCPPVFPGEGGGGGAAAAAAAAPPAPPADKKQKTSAKAAQAKGGAFKATKGKLAKKTGKVARQYKILKMSNVPEGEIPQFSDPEHWLRYFPPFGQSDLKSFGCPVDWRRSFITTSTNRYYDAFIRWQFRKLRQGKKIAFGKRPTVFSVTDGQACADHDRSEGEGVGPQEYTLIKIEVRPEHWTAKMTGCAALAGKRLYLVAATLRPETMYGQTNCFVLPDGDYGAYATNPAPFTHNGWAGENAVFVCSAHAARNMSYQALLGDGTFGSGQEPVLTFKGRELLGLPLKAPRATYETVYCLPLMTIKMDKGTGVVTSVPSDAPDDYAALMDLRNKPKLREKFGITEDMVLPFEVVEILEIPIDGEMRRRSAVYMCEKLKIKSQNDRKKLALAKDEVYLKGFYEGRMLVGGEGVAGELVQDAKPVAKQQMIDAGEACRYFEPEKRVVSRTNDKCVVAHLDQWYLKYGDDEWCERVKAHVADRGDASTFTAYSRVARQNYHETLDWLGEWACSRNFGLGTRVPWDEQFVIESLSDSTIYMAYYTVAHLLQGAGNLDGAKVGPAGIAPEHMDDAAWDYVFLRAAYPSAGHAVPEATLASLRREFEYWPVFTCRGPTAAAAAAAAANFIRSHATK